MGAPGAGPDDGRGVVLMLTDAGRETIDKIAPMHVESVRRHFIDLIDEEQFRVVGEAMQGVRRSLGNGPGRTDD